MLTGEPIVAVATGFVTKSNNPKTGEMIQTWVLRSDRNPMAAVADGSDAAICGDCPLRSGTNIGRACYVTWWMGPSQVYKSMGGYRDVDGAGAREAGRGQQIRVTAYGDPAAVPFDIWRAFLVDAAGWTGYTHQWRTCDPRFRDVVMASVETDAAMREAWAMGWRTFRIRTGDVQAGEVICPASREGGKRTTCDRCNLCQGASNPAKSVAILPHGQRARWLRNQPLGFGG